MAIPDNLKKTFETDFCGRPLIVETGYIAEQANGAVMLRCGDTVLLVTAVASKQPREGIDFFPLTCDYEEKLYAVGRIPGSFPRREGRPSEAAVITSRMIDRPMRPLFPKDFRNDVQIVATVLSTDQEQDPATLAVTGASCALQISGIPHGGPVACVRVGMLDGQLVLNPTLTQINESALDLIVAGTYDAIVMVEAGAHQITEQKMLEALRLAHDEIRKLVEFQRGLHDAIGKPTMSYPSTKISQEIVDAVHEHVASRVGDAARNPHKASREAALDELQAETTSALESRFPDGRSDIGKAYESEVKKAVRNAILNEGIRPDGRRTDEIRPIWCEVGVLPRAHGSALFTRGQTQALSVVTIGSGQDQQKIDGLGLENFKRFMHQYNFPPYSVGEARPLRPPGVVRSVTARWRSARCTTSCPRTRRSRTSSASSPRSSRATARHRWHRCAARASRSWTPASRLSRRLPVSRWDSSPTKAPSMPRSSVTSRAWRTRSATWTSRSPDPKQASPRCRWTARSRASAGT